MEKAVERQEQKEYAEPILIVDEKIPIQNNDKQNNVYKLQAKSRKCCCQLKYRN